MPQRVLLVGDSTLLAVESYGTERALIGFDATLEVASCRTLGIPSCGHEPVPPNSVETIESATGPFDGVVIMAGYDEWWTSFPSSVESVVEVSRAQGATWVLWLTYPNDVPYLLPDGQSANESLVRNNATLRQLAADPAYSDLVLADWAQYSSRAPGWVANDGIHLSPEGALGVADYISRWIAHLGNARCPAPQAPNGSVEVPCSNPDHLASVPDIARLYLSDTSD